MKSRDFVIGFVILVILVAGGLWFVKSKKVTISNLPIETPSITAKIDKAFPNLVIPKGVERADLRDVSGGQSLGVATRTEIVANLPEITNGKMYQGWLLNSEGKSVLLGNFKISKSGWLLNYSSTKYQGFNKVVVKQGDKTILEGSF